MPSHHLRDFLFADKFHFSLSRIKSKEKVFGLFSNKNTMWGVSLNTMNTFSVVHGELIHQHTDSFNLNIPERLATYDLFAYRTKLVAQCVVLSFPWSQSFTIVPIKRRTKHVESTELHSCFIGVIEADENTIVTGAKDSSIVVWDSNSAFEARAYIVAHSAQITALAVNDACDLVVSCDATGLLVYSSATTGNFVRSTFLSEPSTKLHISEIGFVVSVSNIDDDTTKSTSVTILDFGGRVIHEFGFEDVTCTASNVFTLRDAFSFMSLGFSDGELKVIDVISGKEAAESQLDEEIVSVAFVEDPMIIACTTVSGLLYNATLLQ